MRKHELSSTAAGEDEALRRRPLMLFNPLSRRHNKTLTLVFFLPPRRLLSRLRDHYGFVAPPSLLPRPPPHHEERPETKKKKAKKPPYRPPSSLDLPGSATLQSDLPFDFRFSYTESSPAVKPIGLREPRYSPFGPGRLDRTWIGTCAPAIDPTVRSVEGGDEGASAVEAVTERWRRERQRILGAPLTPAERAFLVDKCQKHRTKRQVNLGRDGLTHNMLNDIHNNWKHAEAIRIKCLGVPTVDMKNVCTQLEEKTGGLIIHRHGGQIILYRGRHYNPKKRPVIPLMLWKPHEPIYPRLIKTVIDGLTIEETKEMRKRGLAVPALTKLAKNGYYASLVPMVRDAFLTDELVRIDCKGLEKSDYRKIGLKLRDLVPCVLVTFEKEQIVVWRGKLYNSSEHVNSGENLFSPNSISDIIPEEKTHCNIPDQISDSSIFYESSDESCVADAEIPYQSHENFELPN